MEITYAINFLYPNEDKNTLLDFFIKNYAQKENSILYFTKRVDGDIIIGRHNIPVYYLNKELKVDILVYYPQLFLLNGPEFYFENKPPHLHINNEFEFSVDKKDLRININYFTSWNSQIRNLDEILTSLRNSFNETFPCYNDMKTITTYVGNCNLDFQQLKKINFTQIMYPLNSNMLLNNPYENKVNQVYGSNVNNSNYSNPPSFYNQSNNYNNNQNNLYQPNNNYNNYNNYNNNNNSSYQNNNVKKSNIYEDLRSGKNVGDGNKMYVPPPIYNNNANNNNNNNNINNQNQSNSLNTAPIYYNSQNNYESKLNNYFTDYDLQNILRREILWKIKENKTIDTQMNELISSKNEINMLTNVINNKKVEKEKNDSKLNDNIQKLQEIFAKYESLENSLNQEVETLKIKTSIPISLDCIDNFVHEYNHNKLKYTSYELTLNEYISTFKKLFEKGIITFQEAISYIRKFSRQQYFLKVMQYKANVLNNNFNN